MKCYVGVSDSIKLTDCASGLDTCLAATTGGITAYTCNANDMIFNIHVDNGCFMSSYGEMCVCSTDGCNGNYGNAAIGDCYHYNIYELTTYRKL